MMPPDPSLGAQGAPAHGTAAQRRGGVLFRAGTSDYFLPADVVLRVLSMPKVQPLPGAPPEVLGYVSADWAWHHQHGNAWTTHETQSGFAMWVGNPRAWREEAA